ncbi:MAG: sigma-70 family RNA polymerase sigma factor [Pseudomonadota bacterium]
MAVEQQFQQILAEHASMIQRIAQTHERRPALIQELVQEAAFALWRALPSFRGDSSMRTFVGRITHNVCISHVRKESKGQLDELPAELVDPGPMPDDVADRDGQRAWLLAAVRELPLSLRPVVTLHLEGFSNKEIATALALTPNNVGVRLNRGRTMLKARIEEIR